MSKITKESKPTVLTHDEVALRYKRGVATICTCAVKNNGQKVDFAKIDAGGGPETGIQPEVA